MNNFSQKICQKDDIHSGYLANQTKKEIYQSTNQIVTKIAKFPLVSSFVRRIRKYISFVSMLTPPTHQGQAFFRCRHSECAIDSYPVAELIDNGRQIVIFVIFKGKPIPCR
jgi:hypothetical protein